MTLMDVLGFGGVMFRGSKKSGVDGVPPMIPVEMGDPQAELRNLGPESKVKGTSYNDQQNEVREMIDATKEKRWPGFWYELLQGAYEYNDWNRGLPRILVYYAGVAEPVSLTRFVSDRGRFFHRKVERVEIKNYIRGDTGLRPHNVAATLHEEKDNQVGLSAHGRGMKISSTAAAGHLAKGITFESCVPGIGAWFGRGEIARDEEDPRPSDTFQLRYNNNPALRAKETIFTVLEPNSAALKALSDLPKWFLPTNPAYPSYRLDAEPTATRPNKTTIYANQKFVGAENSLAFSERELNLFGNSGLKSEANAVEPARVEILPDNLTGKRRGKIDYVYVDGLRVAVEGAQFANVYAFWGWGNGDHGFNPRRSNDSLKLANAMNFLLGATLCRCPNPEVFLSILRSNLNDKATFEGGTGIFERHWYDLSKSMTGEAKAAMSAAWGQLTTEIGVKGRVYVTSEKESKQRAKREKKPTILMQQNCLAMLMVSRSDLRTVESVFEDEAKDAEAREAQLKWEKDKLIREKEELKKEAKNRDEYLKLEAAKEAEANAKKRTGIKEYAESTGEFLRVAAPDDPSIAVEMAKINLINLFMLNQGSFKLEKIGLFAKTGKLVIDLQMPELVTLPRNVKDMGPVGDFVLNFLAAGSTTATAEVRYVRNSEGVYFHLGRSMIDERIDKFGNFRIFVNQGSLDMTDKHLVRITLDLGENDETRFNGEVAKIFESLQKADGTPDVDRYLESQYYHDFPPGEDRLKEKRKMEAELQQYEKHLAEENRRRRRVGLPPLPSKYNAKSRFGGHDEFEDEPASGGRAKLPAQRDRKTLDRIRRSEERAIGDSGIDIQDAILSLMHPDARPGITTHGTEKRRRMVQESLSGNERLRNEAAARAREIFKRQLIPDCSMSSSEFSRVRPYLIDHIDDENFGTDDYDILSGFEFGQLSNLPKLRFNKPIGSGLGSLPCPPGYRPVGYYHPEGEIKGLHFSGNFERNVFAISLPRGIDKGLTVYYRKLKSFADTTEPTEENRRCRVKVETLNGPWSELLIALRDSPLNEKQKADIIIRAWSQRGFIYDKSEAGHRKYDPYGSIDSPEFMSAILNFGNGTCGHAEKGWQGAGTACNLAVRKVTSYLAGANGGFSMRENLHGLIQVYIKDRWVLVEPQVGYIDPGYELEEIPAPYREKFTRLIEAIPNAKVTSPERLSALPDVLSENTENYTSMMEELRMKYDEYFGDGEQLTLSDLMVAVRSGFVQFDKRKLALSLAKYSALTLAGAFAVHEITPMIPKLAEMTLQLLDSIPPEKLRNIAIGTIVSIVAISYLGTGKIGFEIGKYIESRRLSLAFASDETAALPDSSSDGGEESPLPAILPVVD